MHYIPGIRIVPSNRQTGSGHRTLSQFKSSKKKVGSLLVGREYEFWGVRKTPQDKFKYMFKDLSTGDIQDMLFDTMLDGDKWIANVRGEELPDYSKFYN
jgi:hypothetical protein